MLRKYFAILAIWAIVAGAIFAQGIPEGSDFWSDYPDEELCDYIVERLSPEELFAQVMMFGWAGQEPSWELLAWVKERGLGSVKVFGWNTEDIKLVAKSITTLQKIADERQFRIPLYVATDQEGGWIRHIKGTTTQTPGNLSIGASGYAIDAFYSGYYISREIAALGINMNFAPTVDLYTNKQSTVIGSRSFGEDPKLASILGAAFAKGCIAAGVIPTAKHFPGHGDTNLDSHGKLPIIDVDIDTFNDRELVPFRALIDADIPAIMSAHLSFPNIDGAGVPASLSHYFLTTVLRETLGYRGLIITDDITMNGATLFAGSQYNAYKLSLEAGNDIVISSTCAALDALLWTRNIKLLKEDSDFYEAVKERARHVILSKMRYFKHSTHVDIYPDMDAIDSRIPDPEGTKFFLEQACRSITLYKRGSNYPFDKDGQGEGVLLMGQFPAFFDEGKKRYPKAKYFQFTYELGPNETQWVKDNIAGFLNNVNTIVICVSQDRSEEIANYIRRFNKRVIVLSIMSPVDIMDWSWADTILLGYSYAPVSFSALFGALKGEYTPQGILPISKD